MQARYVFLGYYRMYYSNIYEFIKNATEAKETSTGLIAKCPAHPDKTPSLNATQTADGTILLKCQAGCPTEAVVSALGLKMRDLFPASNFTTQQRKNYKVKKTMGQLYKALAFEMVALYSIVDTRAADAELIKNKNFRQLQPEWQPMPAGHWDREILAATRIKKLIVEIYHV